MSTEDCKALLVKEYPHTSEKEWKREAKFKNLMEDEIRRFRHPVVGAVLINEDREEISINDQDMFFRPHNSFQPQDFYFTITPYDDYHRLYLAEKRMFDAEGAVEDVHVEWIVKSFLPKKGMKFDECMESVFDIKTKLSIEEIRAAFLQAGFHPSEALDAEILRCYD
jgi:hypothetical protein